jgi:hypothetical protein
MFTHQDLPPELHPQRNEVPSVAFVVVNGRGRSYATLVASPQGAAVNQASDRR